MARDEIYVNVKSTNIWDEVQSSGYINPSDGVTIVSSSNNYHSDNYIPVKPSTNYTVCTQGGTAVTSCRVFYYDASKNYISNETDLASYETPANAAFIRFHYYSSSGALLYSVVEGTTPYPYMPHDTKGKVWKRQQVGRVDLGDLSYTRQSAGAVYYFLATITGKKAGSADGLCTHYPCVNVGGFSALPDNTIGVKGTDNSSNIGIRNDLYDNAATFPTAMSGVMYYYLLTNPIWTDITSSAMGAALLALETIEESSNTITINNSGVIDMVQYFTPI